jgi:hypothetical protein
MPPDVAQQANPEVAQSVLAQQGVGPQQNASTDAAGQVKSKLMELEKWAGEMKHLLDTFDPSLGALLQPIAQAGVDLGKALQEKQQRSGAATGSPVVPPQPPVNPAAGLPNPGGPQG